MPSRPVALPESPSFAFDALEVYRREMVSLLERLNPVDGNRTSAVDGVAFFRTRASTQPVPVFYEPCIVVVAQGRKRLHLEDRVLTYDEGNFLVLSVPAPALCETDVTGDRPFLALCARIDLALLGELVVAIGEARERTPPAREAVASAPPLTLEVANVDDAPLARPRLAAGSAGARTTAPARVDVPRALQSGRRRVARVARGELGSRPRASHPLPACTPLSPRRSTSHRSRARLT